MRQRVGNTDSSNALSEVDDSREVRNLPDEETVWDATNENTVNDSFRSQSSSRSRQLRDDSAAEIDSKGVTSHTRRDLLTGDWTIFSPVREQRPNDFSASSETSMSVSIVDRDAEVDPFCPFCVGSEGETPEAVWSASLEDGVPSHPGMSSRLFCPNTRIVAGEQKDWQVRVVPNKFPAVDFSSASDSTDHESGLFPTRALVGGHEVVVESASHAERVTHADPSVVFMMLLAYRDRIRHWRSVDGIQYISVFKNCGPAAGASLRHSHSQVVATSVLPNRVKGNLLRSETHRARTGCSLGCDLLRGELDDGSRVIATADSFVAYCPFASRVPGLIRISSIAHRRHFDEFTELELDHLASFLWRALGWVDRAYPEKAYNLFLSTCPPRGKSTASFQWSLDLFPRLSKIAGFEWSSDCMINPLLPETAAETYRRTASLDDPRRVLANA